MQRANIRLTRQTTGNGNKMEMSKKAIIFLFNNVEETEFVITTNVLRRAGLHVIVAGVEENLEPIKGVEKIIISPDTSWFIDLNSNLINY